MRILKLLATATISQRIYSINLTLQSRAASSVNDLVGLSCEPVRPYIHVYNEAEARVKLIMAADSAM